MGIDLGCSEGRGKAGGNCYVQMDGRVVGQIGLGRIELALVDLLFLWG